MLILSVHPTVSQLTPYKVLKCDITNIRICEIMGFVEILGKSMMKNAYLPKISILLQFGGEMLALLCSDGSSIFELVQNIM